MYFLLYITVLYIDTMFKASYLGLAFSFSLEVDNQNPLVKGNWHKD